jgi:rare lipoprotein A
MKNNTVVIVSAVLLALICSLLITSKVKAEETASYYTLKSCLREGTSGVMANGKKLNDKEDTCASWDYPFKTLLRVTNLNNGKAVYVKVTDRGPAKRLYRKGRVIDLSLNAYKQIASLKTGVIPVNIDVVRYGNGVDL